MKKLNDIKNGRKFARILSKLSSLYYIYKIFFLKL
jgi:hypothetical protein